MILEAFNFLQNSQSITLVHCCQKFCHSFVVAKSGGEKFRLYCGWGWKAEFWQELSHIEELLEPFWQKFSAFEVFQWRFDVKSILKFPTSLQSLGHTFDNKISKCFNFRHKSENWKLDERPACYSLTTSFFPSLKTLCS